MLRGRKRRAAGSKSSRHRIGLSRRAARARAAAVAAAAGAPAVVPGAAAGVSVVPGAAITPDWRSAIVIAHPVAGGRRPYRGPLSGGKLFAIWTGVNTKAGRMASLRAARSRTFAAAE